MITAILLVAIFILSFLLALASMKDVVTPKHMMMGTKRKKGRIVIYKNSVEHIKDHS